MEPKDLLVPLASVLVAILVFAGVLVNALVRRKKPTETTDLWAENRKLNEDLGLLRREFETYRDAKDQEFRDYKKEMDDKLETRDRERTAFRHLVSVISEGFDAAWTYVNVLKATMTDAGIVAPEPSVYVKMATEAARDLRASNPLGGTP